MRVRYLKKNIKRDPAAGQPPYPDLVMFKALMLQSLYNLPDEAAPFAMRDRISFLQFIGLPFESAKPNGSAICRFRNSLLENGHDQKLWKVTLEP